MPRRTLFSTEAELKAVATPNHGGRYTVITHGLIIDTIKSKLEAAGLSIVNELYRSTNDGQIATGTYWLSRSNDPDISMMMSWTNSYNKMVRFLSVVGGYVHANSSHIVGNNLNTFSRKHMGNADQEAINTIDQQISKADLYFNTLVADKDVMKQHLLTKQEQAEIAGRIFIELEDINKEQLGIIRDQIRKCEFDYNSDPNSFWSFYNHFNYALRFGHPKTWMVQQSQIHNFLINYMNERKNADLVDTVVTPIIVDPNQLSIFDLLKNTSEKLSQDLEVLKLETETSNDNDDDVFDIDDLNFEGDEINLSDL